MSFSFGAHVRVTLFGQSHADAVGVVIAGLPAGFTVDLATAQAFLARRAPQGDGLSTARRERDVPRILSGLSEGKTCGAPLCAVFEHQDARRGDYAALRGRPRPSHADYPAYVKYGDAYDYAGGGQFSARLTVALCFAGAVCAQLLAARGVTVGAHILSVGDGCDAAFDPLCVSAEQLHAVQARAFPVLDENKSEYLKETIREVAKNGDSIGGVVECAAVGLPAGLGEPPFGGVENRITQALFAVPAVRGVEFGAGFAAARMRGSEHNDPYALRGNVVVTVKNDAGGVLGGLTTGMPLLFRAAFKPTPSIALPQQTVDLAAKAEVSISVAGRHDPCVAVRAVPCVEAAAAIALCDLMLGGPI